VAGEVVCRSSVQRLTGTTKLSEKPVRKGEPAGVTRWRKQPKALAGSGCFGTPQKWCSIAMPPQQTPIVWWTLVWVQSKISVSSSQ
jgi:hypothetical protein